MGELTRIRHRAESHDKPIVQSSNSSSEAYLFIQPSSGFVEAIEQNQIADWYVSLPRELVNRGRYELIARTHIRRQEAPALLRVVNDFSSLSISI